MDHREYLAQRIKSDLEFEELWFANRTLDTALKAYLEHEDLSNKELMQAVSRFWWDFPQWLHEKRYISKSDSCQMGEVRPKEKKRKRRT